MGMGQEQGRELKSSPPSRPSNRIIEIIITWPLTLKSMPQQVLTASEPYSAPPYSAPPYSAPPYSAPPYSASPYSAPPYSTPPYSASPAALEGGACHH